MSQDKEREIAVVESCTLKTYGGHLAISMSFNYDGAGCQGMNLSVNSDFIVQLMDIFDVDDFSKIQGKHCKVTHTHSAIRAIEPLMNKYKDRKFDIEAWQTRFDTEEGKPEKYKFAVQSMIQRIREAREYARELESLSGICEYAIENALKSFEERSGEGQE